MDGPLRFGELRRRTSLSETWLSKVLRELLLAGVVEVGPDRRYRLRWRAVERLLRRDLEMIARLAMVELVTMVQGVVAVFLIGSVARGAVRRWSDVDLLVVVKTRSQSVRESELQVRLFEKFRVSFDLIVVSLSRFLAELENPSSLLLEMLRGYRPLFDPMGLTELIRESEKHVRKRWRYDSKLSCWIRR